MTEINVFCLWISLPWWSMRIFSCSAFNIAFGLLLWIPINYDCECKVLNTVRGVNRKRRKAFNGISLNGVRSMNQNSLALAESNLHSTRRLVSHICNSSSAQIVQEILFWWLHSHDTGTTRSVFDSACSITPLNWIHRPCVTTNSRYPNASCSNEKIMRGERRKRAILNYHWIMSLRASNNKNGNFTTTSRRRFISLFTLMNTIEI